MNLATIHCAIFERGRRPLLAFGAFFLFSPAGIVGGCATPAPPWPTPIKGDSVYIVAEGWHVEVGLPSGELKGPLAAYRDVFPGAAVIMFGYGKRSFMTGTAAQRVIGYLVGPLPGESTIEVSAVTTTPADAFGPAITTTLSLPLGGAEALSNFIWSDLEKDKVGDPRLIEVRSERNSLLYGARSEYNLEHTCNTWVVDALATAGLPTSSAGVVFSGQAVDRARMVAENQCTPSTSGQAVATAGP